MAVALASLLLSVAPALGAPGTPANNFHKDIQPLLTKYCSDCHADGANKGGIAFDELKDSDLTTKPELWWKVLKNVRAGLMPPEKKPRPSAEERETLAQWIKYQAFGIDPAQPDPGRVTVRRLNRVEYANTIHDLMGVDFKADEEFPPDDTGYGFDNIGDVLTLSPLLLEKYMQAAETIAGRAVPIHPRSMDEKVIAGKDFRGKDLKPERLSFYTNATLRQQFDVKQSGDYKLVLDLDVFGEFDFDPGRCKVRFSADNDQLLEKELGWSSRERYTLEVNRKWEPGTRSFQLRLEPLTPLSEKTNEVNLRVVSLKIIGPKDRQFWVRTRNYDRFFTREMPPDGAKERRDYAREVLARFVTKAFRSPADARTIDRLAAIAEDYYRQPGKQFEEGISRALVAVLASPRFLFRVENVAQSHAHDRFAPVDEYALASRLSYFLWSTMPDDELFALAARGDLRKNLGPQVKRMLADERSHALVANFTGQWLQARDIDGIDINARAVLARDNGEEKEMRRRFEEFRASLTNRVSQANTNRQRFGNRRRFFEKPKVELDNDLRRALRQETEMFFSHIMRENRSVLEMIDSDYTFLNEKLAKHYGITNVLGERMRRVSLPADSPRGGLLTEGTVLIVTSNPTRTSPVKRGLFLLDNIMGMPPPPPPPDVPLLEESEKQFGDREPTLREVLELHRSKALCSSCHSRMDPLGLARENFNALGMWREKERNQPIEPVGKLITGEPFTNIRELKQILKTRHQLDFYRCLTEKLLTYALGRGIEYYDVETVDNIVSKLDRDGGHFSALLIGIVESPPFQQRRNTGAPESPDTVVKQAALQP